MAELCGVIGIGQTKYAAARRDVSMAGLLREAAERALADAECDWRDIDAVVIGKAPDMFEGVMMPELFLAEAVGGAYKPMLRVHTAGSVGRLDGHRGREPGAERRARPRAHRRLREAERVERDLGALDRAALRGGHRGWRGRLLRPADPRLHPALRGARGHRHPCGAEGPPERAQEPARPPPAAGHQLREDRELADALGSRALPRDLPFVRRRLRDGDGARAARRALAAQSRLDPRDRDAQRAHHVLRARSGDAARDPRQREVALQEGAHHQPAPGNRLRRESTCPSRGSSRCGWRAC